MSRIWTVLALYLLGAYFLGGVIALAEGWSVGAAAWFVWVTITTTGYGDLTPHTAFGRVLACALMGGAWVANVLLAGLVAAKLIVDADAWTHAEQEAVKRDLREIRDLLRPKPPLRRPAGERSDAADALAYGLQGHRQR